MGGVDSGDDLPVDPADVRGIQGAVQAQDQQPVDRHGAVAGEVDVPTVSSRLQLRQPDVVELVDDEEQRQPDTDRDGDEQTEAQPADGGDGRHPELHAPEPPESQQLPGLDQAEHRNHDHASECRFRQVTEQAAEKQGATDRESCCDQLAELSDRARSLVDRRLREAAGGRHRPEPRAHGTGDPIGGELLVVVDGRLVVAPHAAGDRRRFEEAHDGDGERPGRQGSDVVERGGDWGG